MRLRRFFQLLVTPITKDPVFWWVAILLMSVPGMLWYVMVSAPPPFRLIALLLFTTMFPALVAYTLLLVINASGKARKAVKVTVYTVLIILYTINVFLILNVQAMLSPWTLLLAYETNARETNEFFESYLFRKESLISYIVVLGTMLLIWLFENRKSLLSQPGRKAKTWGGIVLAAWLTGGSYQAFVMAQLLACNNQTEIEHWYEARKGIYCTQNTMCNAFYSITHLYYTRKVNSTAMNASLEAWKKPAGIEADDSLCVILVIGESYNKYHASLYGYELDTTPYMERELKAGRLFVFTDVISPYNMTTLSVKNMLSTNSLSLGEHWYDFPVFPVIFRKAGFTVNMWDNQKAIGGVSMHDFSLSSFLHSQQMAAISYSRWNESINDDDLLFVDSCLRANDLDKGSSLAIFHLNGQHAMAKWRYPETESVFTAADVHRPELSLEERQAIAEYDNATRYNDRVVGKIMYHFSSRNAIMVYLSDHGEEVYDYRHHLGRTHERAKGREALKYQYEVPFFIWCSDSYSSSHQQTVAQIKAASDKPFMTDNLPHLLFALANLQTCYYREDKNPLCNRYHCGKRKVQDTTDYDEAITD